jgi:hypothetical protein
MFWSFAEDAATWTFRLKQGGGPFPYGCERDACRAGWPTYPQSSSSTHGTILMMDVSLSRGLEDTSRKQAVAPAITEATPSHSLIAARLQD